MKTFTKSLLALAATSVFATSAFAAEPVHMGNIVHAITDSYFDKQVKTHAVNEFKHTRVAINVQNQVIIRSNVDLIYSTAVVDVSKGADFSTAESDQYQIMQLIDQNHKIVGILYPGDKLHVEQSDLTEGDHLYVLMRTVISEKYGLEFAHKMQDGAVISAKSAKPYVGIDYDQELLKVLRNSFQPDVGNIRTDLAFGMKDETYVTPYQYRLGAAIGWAGLSSKDAIYTARVGQGNETCSTFTFKNPELNVAGGGYWSITAYGADGFLATDKAVLVMYDAVPNEDETYTINFNCPDAKNNSLETAQEWGIGVRFYRPTDPVAIVDAIRELPQIQKGDL